MPASRMTTMTTNRIGELLLQKGLISEAQLAEALKEHAATKQPLGTIVTRRGWVASEQVTETLAEQYRMPFVRLRDVPVDRAAIERMPLKVALHYTVIPLKAEGSTLTIAMANPQDVRVLDDVRLALHQRYTIQAALATEDDLRWALKTYYGLGAEITEQIVGEQRTQAPVALEEPVDDLERMADDASVVKLVNQLLLEAHRQRATDIHLEPYRDTVRMRYRIDGILQQVKVPAAIRQVVPAIMSRLKIMATLNIVERRRPQDGRATIKVGEAQLDLRLSFLPTPHGEGVVIRILPTHRVFDLTELGYADHDMKLLEEMLHKPHGLILVTGPTGSGKTTTLYAFLTGLNTDDRKIIAIEDPVEYEQPGITQVQVNPSINLTFAEGLRSMLRHDPNVMMVGEIRDVETAELAIRIALTGHLVFSTLHTNDAASAATRLMDMGISPYLITSAVEGIIAQRLVRVICRSCREPTTSPWPGVSAFRGRGCEHCQQTGYHGRAAIYEILRMTDPIQQLILQRASADALRRKAIEAGMRTLRQHGVGRVQAGDTSPEEVLRVTESDDA